MLRAFPSEPSADAGGRLVLHVATDAPSFRVRIERWSDGVQAVHEAGPFAGEDAPPGAPDAPWDWPSIELTLPRDLAPGAYVARFVTDGGSSGRGAPRDDTPDARWGTALFALRAPSQARVLVNLPLFTYQAYNGAHVRGAPGGDEGASLRNGHPAVTLRRPGGGTGGHPWDEAAVDFYDRTSPRHTFAHWDLYALQWFAREGIAVDVCTDLDLHRGDVDLARYALLCSFGDDEYWTPEKRAHVESWLEGGGNVAFFGGNTCRHRVRYDDAGASIAAGGAWPDDEPEDTLTGLSHRRGGAKWIASRPAAAYRIERGAHAAVPRRARAERRLDRCGLVADRICGRRRRSRARAGRFRRARARAARRLERHGRSGELAQGGHAAMVTFRRGDGTVFNAGTTDWARALGWGDARVKAITRSVVRRLTE